MFSAYGWLSLNDKSKVRKKKIGIKNTFKTADFKDSTFDSFTAKIR